MSITEKLTELKGLLDAGILTQEEFDAQKAAILEGNVAAQSAPPASAPAAPEPAAAPAPAATPSTPAADAPPCPPTYMVHAIIATLFCCLPVGIVAIIKASGVSKAHAAGNYEEAEAASKSAKMWVNISAVPALLYALFFILSGVIQVIAAL